MDKIRVFLVEDHPMMRIAMRTILEASERFSIVGEANNAEESIEIIDTVPTDMVVMDIQLPGIDGVEATRQLKARHGHLKVVIMSAFGEEYLIPSIEAGADGYMMKGLAPNEVVDGLLQAAAGTPPIDQTLTRHLMNRAADGESARVGPSLSTRQQEVLRRVSDGLTSKEIASGLSISGTTLKREFRNIFEALGVNDRAHAIAEAYRRDLI
ncbi:MAG: response regulator transcription factor [Chloroflexi bacterium]|nr:response regulator transcription factor [Chloroflexota bacterium]MCH8350853.1 response regulator transcription factor [Chloroflexota bacterium]MCI0781487.1 response regulator transcription factor [Chloroflexota bacterium]MCI0786176.1 response regulator transcription factor [Chloroflexota bacterium]MCI0793771.1 response regulator transcription factor [Chloroflexota bacterium]